MVQIDRRRRFLLLECPYCHQHHDVLLGGGRQVAPCKREMEAQPGIAGAEAQVWGLPYEGREPARARIVA